MAFHRPTEQEMLDTGAPCDFSFRKLTSLSELKDEKPRSYRLGRTPLRGASMRFLTRSIWLNHNQLTDIKNVESMVGNILEQPSALAWLDFSFNNIREIDDGISNLHNLKVLYFHGNSIANLNTISKLSKLKVLKNLTLHGNPIETIPSYRGHLVYMLPQVVNLDFARVVPSERLMAPPPGTQKRPGQPDPPKPAAGKR